MLLNTEQKKHLATTFRIVGIAFFGYFGYYGLRTFGTHWPLVIWSVIVFLLTEYSALLVLED